MVQYANGAENIEQALRERFAKFDLELHPAKTRVISFGRYERQNAKRQNRRANTFNFLGFTHYCGMSRKGKFIVGRKTSRKKFRKKCMEMNNWLRKIRNYKKAKEWWPVLQAKLRGHYQYYGVSLTERMTLKWLNRRSQRKSFNWKGFYKYLEHYPLPEPRIVHNLYTLSPVV